jgi:hypothetical protein
MSDSIYRYLEKEEHFNSWCEGYLWFGSAEYYRKIEDKKRQDKTEYSDYFFVNEWSGNALMKENGRFAIEGFGFLPDIKSFCVFNPPHTLQNTWIACFSIKHSNDLVKKFNAKYCVEFDKHELEKRVLVLNNFGRAYCGMVNYSNIKRLNDRTGFVKPEFFRDEAEWRIIFQPRFPSVCKMILNKNHLALKYSHN